VRLHIQCFFEFLSCSSGHRRVEVAIKAFKRFPGFDQTFLHPWVLREITFLRSIRHPNILALRSVLRSRSLDNDGSEWTTSLVFPFAEYDLSVRIK
jgi:hypothetical protein